VRARHDAHTITASQADAAEITQRALTAATVLAPFQPDRMTWIKPSLLWTMDRAGRATKPGQERVPATAIRRDASSGAGPFLPPPPPTRHRRQPRGMAEQPRGCLVRVQGIQRARFGSPRSRPGPSSSACPARRYFSQ
jgi:hypothetical protein